MAAMANREVFVTSADVVGCYTEQLDMYEGYARKSFSWFFIEKPYLDKYLTHSLTPGTRVLDAGCGVGRSVEYLRQKGVWPENILALDLNHQMVTRARDNIAEAGYIQGNLTNLPIEDDSVDLVLCSHVVHYLDDSGYKAAMDNFARVLRSGGKLIIITAHPMRISRHNLAEYQERRWKMDRTPWGAETPFFTRTLADYFAQTRAAGFEIIGLDEPEIDPKAKKEGDAASYESYAACPPRLIITAVKS